MHIIPWVYSVVIYTPHAATSDSYRYGPKSRLGSEFYGRLLSESRVYTAMRVQVPNTVVY